MQRRALIKGLVSLVAAPAIVKASSLMAISAPAVEKVGLLESYPWGSFVFHGGHMFGTHYDFDAGAYRTYHYSVDERGVWHDLGGWD